jgi:hypothetical protein
MALRQALAVALGAALVLPPSAFPAAVPGLVKGNVTTLAGTPVSGADVDLLSLDNGTLTRLRTDGGGAFEASLEPGSYKVELQKDYVVVRGPSMVAVASANTAPAELVVASAQAAPEASQPNPAATGAASRTGDIIAVSVFAGALAGVSIYAATNGPEDRQPPSSSPRR